MSPGAPEINEDYEDITTCLKKSYSENGIVTLWRQAIAAVPSFQYPSSGLKKLVKYGYHDLPSLSLPTFDHKNAEQPEASPLTDALDPELDGCPWQMGDGQSSDISALRPPASPTSFLPSWNRIRSVDRELALSIDLHQVSQKSHRERAAPVMQPVSSSPSGTSPKARKTPSQHAHTIRSVSDVAAHGRPLVKATPLSNAGGDPASAHPKFRRAKTSALTSVYCPQDSSDDDCEEGTRQITAKYRSRINNTDLASRSSITLSPVKNLRLVESPAASEAGLESDSSTASTSKRGNYHLSNREASFELDMRLNHSRQTVDFVKEQASQFSKLNKEQMNLWEALDLLDGIDRASSIKYGMTPREHAIQTAELCRLAYPENDWMHLVGLIHGIGKLLLHKKFGPQPAWAVNGESFPVGCRFDTHIQGAQFFTANPDRRRKQYNTPAGIYQAHCGLKNVFMSWSAAEYSYLMLLLNNTQLPEEALFMIRHQKFWSLPRPQGKAYASLVDEGDRKLLPLLASFQKLTVYKKVEIPAEVTLKGAEFDEYYNRLIKKYIGAQDLAW
eukprot:gene1685-33081_t